MAYFNIPGDTWREKAATWLAGADAATEADSEYDGLLSYASENHAAILGFVVCYTLGLPGLGMVVATALGLARWKQISNRKAVRELRKEPWYGIGAGFLGYLVQYYDILAWILDLLQSLPF